ncbi:hypothetical protein VTN00DRAFT_9872 [Thermoascus crustaceus]|uniref:uncharacterized protein n=1 Tax=Thermoascus crustaceus TaxID=5088 RepID=UPI0037429671
MTASCRRSEHPGAAQPHAGQVTQNGHPRYSVTVSIHIVYRCLVLENCWDKRLAAIHGARNPIRKLGLEPPVPLQSRAASGGAS